MSAARHTSGPWQSQHDFDMDGLLTIIGNVDGEYTQDGVQHTYTTVAEVQETDDPDETRANIRLIEAAPDMLDALKTTLSNIRSLGPAGALGPVFSSYQPWLEVVEDAVAKAEGRLP